MPRKSGSDHGFETVDDEESVGSRGRGGLGCRVSVSGARRSFTTQSSGELSPGTIIRVSVGASGSRGKKLKRVARMLAFVDSITGELVVRMGMFDISGSNKGQETGPQVVWRSDVPVVDLDPGKE